MIKSFIVDSTCKNMRLDRFLRNKLGNIPQSLIEKSLNEIKEVLTGMSLYLGMEIPNWPPDNIAEMSKKLEEAI